MKKGFVGRERELKSLKDFFEKPGFGAALLYGRRRVGKSELAKQAVKDLSVPVVHYECKRVSEATNALSLGETVSEALGLPLLGYAKIEPLLRYLFKAAEERKIVLVLDEYPYLREGVEGLDSILQSLIDEYRGSSNLSLLLLGSSIEVMKSLLEYENPLYGRLSLKMLLEPMDYFDSARFYPSFSYEDRIRLYSVFGGIPYYNGLIEEDRSVRENLISLIAGDGAYLLDEVPYYLSAQLSKMENANEVFLSLAEGKSKYGDILSSSGVSSSPTLSDVLAKLIGMGLVERLSPINDEKNKKKASYRISDPLSSFYYRYDYRYFSQLKTMEPKAFFGRYIEKDFEEQYVPKAFERVCREYLLRKNREGKIVPPLEKIGKYWYDLPKERKNGEFDIVSLDELGYVFYEAKFSKNPLSRLAVEKELEQVSRSGLSCYKTVFFLRAGTESEKTEGVEFLGLSDLFE